MRQREAAYYGQDEGCEARPRCLTCDLPACIFDSPRARRRWQAAARSAPSMTAALAEGTRVPVLAKQYHLSCRDVAVAIVHFREAAE